MANNVSFFKKNPILTVAIVAVIMAILGFSKVFVAVAGIAKILFIVSLIILGLLLFRKYGKSLKK